MANEHGHLTKASRDDLDPSLRRRLEVWYDKAYTDDNLFLTLAANEDVLEMFLAWVKAAYDGSSGLDPHLVELCRIRMANRNECFH